jgi:3-methyladenine DNA glycosylase/8-oxoguanine DNA glycosylase
MRSWRRLPCRRIVLTRMWTTELRLRGAGGEPVDLRRTIYSHGVADLPPMRASTDARVLEATLAPNGYRPRTVRIHAGRRGRAALEVDGPRPGPNVQEALVACVHHVLSLDQDLSPFYAKAATDPALAWAAEGAGRMIRSPTVFEDVVKTICTTNVAWSATVRMVSALVANLGEPAPGAPAIGWEGRAFPTPAAMAAVGERFYRDVVRAGYRAAYLRDLARGVAEGRLDLESLGATGPDALSDDEAYARLLALPGVGPYAAAHVLMVLGRHSRLVLDSWTRPTYARLAGRRTVADAAIVRRFRRYGPYAGLAFWLFLTRDWVTDDAPTNG